LTQANLEAAPKSDNPQVQSFLRKYKKYWRRRKFRLAIEPLYNRLFEWFHDQHEDLVWGLGHASMKTQADQIINGPLLEVRVEVELARDGALLVRPREHTGVSLNRQVMMALTTSGDSLARNLNRTVEELDTCDFSPGEPSTYIPLLKRISVELSSGGTFETSKSLANSSTDDRGLVVTDAWCLFSCPKPSAVWARDASKFVETLSRHDFILPKALWALTHGPGVLETLERGGFGIDKPDSKPSALSFLKAAFVKNQSEEPIAIPPRPLFPLPTSEAQNRIADLLLTRNYPAVVCEGPPGTGKYSHYLSFLWMVVVLH
jgi:hypothetical protein